MVAKRFVEGMPYWRTLLRLTLYVSIVCVVLYGSPVTDLVRLRGDQFVVHESRLLTAWGAVAYIGSWTLLVVLVGVTMLKVAPTSAGFKFLTSMVVLSGFYLADPFLSTSPNFQYGEQTWIYLVLSLFFLTILATETSEHREQLLDFVLFCIGLQSVFAILYYVYDINQFVTPGFGRRTSGTFFNPNVLYPLSLTGAILSFYRALYEASRPLRLVLWGICLLSTVATALTFTRTAWLALSIVIGVVVLFHRSRLSNWWRASLMLLAIFFLAGALFIRTKGQLVGSAEDRSFWGRWQIWKVSLHIYMNRPLLGHGFQTYLVRRNEFMTSELQAFGPLNTKESVLEFRYRVWHSRAGCSPRVTVPLFQAAPYAEPTKGFQSIKGAICRLSRSDHRVARLQCGGHSHTRKVQSAFDDGIPAGYGSGHVIRLRVSSASC